MYSRGKWAFVTWLRAAQMVVVFVQLLFEEKEGNPLVHAEWIQEWLKFHT